MVFVFEIKNYESVKIVRMASLNNISLDTTRGGENIGEVSSEEQGLIYCAVLWMAKHTSPEAWLGFNEWKPKPTSKIISIFH